MSRDSRPVELLDSFMKAAKAMGISSSGVGSKLIKKSLTYSTPNAPVATTNPGLVATQKAVPPPPVQ